MTVPIGSMSSYFSFGGGDHGWTEGMNHNMLKAATMLHCGVKSRVTTLPVSPSPSDIHLYVGPTTELIATNSVIIWAKVSEASHHDWHYITPIIGGMIFVADERKIYVYTNFNEWEVGVDLDDPRPSMERELSFFAPGLVVPRGTLLEYVATMEFVLRAGAPGSKAFLQVPPTGGNLVMSMSGGTLTFLDGSHVGTFSIPNDVFILPAEFETLYSRPGVFHVTGPNNNYGAEGLSVSIKGELRSIHVG